MRGVNGAPVDQQLRVTVVWDALSNQRAVLDGTSRLVMAYDYDLDGHRLHQSSLDAGELWQLDDVAGCTIRTWDGRGIDRRLRLRRPASANAAARASAGTERLAERMEYGESVPDAAASNLRLRLSRSCDSAGTLTHEDYDFTGHAVNNVRDLLTEHSTPVDWALDPPTAGGHFRVQRSVDALERTIELTTPDGSVQRPCTTSPACSSRSPSRCTVTPWRPSVVAGADYDERGRRRAMQLGNGASTTWTFDDTSHLLTAMRTIRPGGNDTTASAMFIDPTVVQDQRYTYDPSGNVTRIDDAAAATVVNAGQVVTGRARSPTTRPIDWSPQPVGSTSPRPRSTSARRRAAGAIGRSPAAHPNDGQAMRNYTQAYSYDDAGNLTTVRHLAANAGWTRQFSTPRAACRPGPRRQPPGETTVGGDAETYG